MKRYNYIVVIMLFLASPLSVLATEQELSASPAGTAVSWDEAATPVQPAMRHAEHHQGMKHKGGCRHKGQGGMKHGAGHQDKHAQVVKRLDMIEARMAKIESMLESLMKR